MLIKVTQLELKRIIAIICLVIGCYLQFLTLEIH
jgi:hypothetical protein